MTENHDKAFLNAIDRQAKRARRRRPLGFLEGVGMAGTVGWMIALPTVLGAMLGRWLDDRFGSGSCWTLSLLGTGLALGIASAWRHVERERPR